PRSGTATFPRPREPVRMHQHHPPTSKGLGMFRRVFLAVVLAGVALLVPFARPQGNPPSVAEHKVKVPDGLVAKLFACEPMVRQPILVKCDDRGRLWTIQYLQYPNPAGLKRV